VIDEVFESIQDVSSLPLKKSAPMWLEMGPGPFNLSLCLAKYHCRFLGFNRKVVYIPCNELIEIKAGSACQLSIQSLRKITETDCLSMAATSE